MQNTLLSILFLLCTLLLSPGTSLALTAERLNLVLYDQLEQYTADFSDPRTDSHPDTIQRWLAVIYGQAGLQPLWITKDGPGQKAEKLLTVLKNCRTDGLDPEQYHASQITSLWNDQTPEGLIKLDTLLTLGLIKYAHDAGGGRTLFITNTPPPAFDALELVKTALSSPDLSEFLSGLLPPHRYYRNLRIALPYYQNLAASGGWPLVDSGKTIHPGEQDERIPVITKRLQIEGFLQSTATTDTTRYDETYVQAVTQFQLHHGLTRDGIIGKLTINAMNITAEKKTRQILINLERWRLKNHDLGRKYVVVDIAGFTLEGIADDTVILEMPVIVGTRQNETPVFSDQIKYMELNPFWNIPPSIARNEMLSDLKKNPRYLSDNHIRLFSDWTTDAKEINPLSVDWQQISPKQMGQFKLRQEPGKKNALGLIKFIFPNNYSVYMHDTPARALFQRSSRAFSHGCIRLEKPVKLADFLMSDFEIDWSKERFHEIIDSGKRTIISLPEPLPVHITYQTAKSNQDGTTFFHTDIYDRDRKLEQILFKE